MKKIFIIGLSLFVFTLFSCSNSVDETDTEKETSITVSGRVTFSEAADNSRTATSSFSEGNINWVLTAYSFDNRETPDTSKTYKPIGYEKGNYFKFVFPKNGTYLIEARGMLDNGVCAYGSEAVEITDNKSRSISVTALPQASAVLGNVRLTVNLDSAVAPYIKKVSVNWIGLEDRVTAVMTAMGFEREGNAAPSPEVEANIAKLEEWQGKCSAGAFNKDFSVSSGKALISLDGIFCGAHAVEISFIDNENRTVYKCKEMINVYSGFTTDSWHGSSKFISNGSFVLPKRTVIAYGVLTIPNYSPVLYSVSDSGYKIMRDEQTLTSNSDTNQFAFDSNGNVFVVTSTSTTDLTIVTDKPGCEGKNYYVYKEEECTKSGIIIDSVTNDLYTYNFNDSTSERGVKLYKYSEFDSSTEQWPSYDDEEITFDCTSYFNDLYQWGYFIIRSVTVHDGIIYVYASGENAEGNHNTLAKYENGSLSKIFYSENPVFPKFESDSPVSYGNFTDMVYQDGYIYLLYNEKMINPDDGEIPNLLCHGGIARIKVSDGALERCGWAYDSNALVKFNFSETSSDKFAIGQYVWEGSESHESYIYENESKNKALVLGKNYFKEEFFEEWDDLIEMTQTMVVSDKKTDKCFCGPQRIIAVKPKKLVIADNGIAFYTTQDGIWAYKNKNRIVTVELDRFIIEDVKDAESAFSNKMNKMLLLSGSGYSPLKADKVDGYYYDFVEQEWLLGKIRNQTGYLCIPNID